MRASVPLLLLAAVAAAHPPAPPPPTPPAPALLVLRSACPLRDRTLFSQRRLLAYAKDARHLAALQRPLRLLSYEDDMMLLCLLHTSRGHGGADSGNQHLRTCTRRSVWWSGRDGSGACDALVGPARALRRPQPAACAAPDARAAAVARLAVRLRWRRVLLPPRTALGTACARALRSVEVALAAVGLSVRRLNDSRDLTYQPHASLVCVSSYSTLIKQYTDFGILLILHVEELELSDSRLVTDDEIITEIPVMSLLYVNTSPSAPASLISRTVNLSSTYSEELLIPTSPVAAPLQENKNVGAWIEKSSMESRVVTTEPLNTHLPTLRNSSKILKSETFVRGRRKVLNRMKRSFDSLQSVLMKLDKSVRSRSLLLSSEIEESPSKTLDVGDVYRDALETAQRYAYAERTGIETVRKAFFLYESSTARKTQFWDRVATFSTVSTRNIGEAGDWVTIVDTVNTTAGFTRWKRGGVEEGEASAGAAVGVASALCAVTALALVAGGTVLVRAARRRHVRRRPRAAVLLAPADFTFPADEGRRVGEGMETMLSWLQQLHEFAGPEPDLLPPRAPSAPSSTCSVARLALDTRVRYKGEPVLVRYLPAAALEPRRKATDVLLVMQSLRHENLNPFIGCLPELRPALVWEVCGRGSLEDVLVADDIRLDWTFRLSLLTDLVRGMRYLHASPLRVHGRLSSRACLVDSRWVLRVADYGAPAFTRAQGLPQPPRDARDLLWTAPELLRQVRAGGGGEAGSQPGDVFSFAIVMQEVIVRGEPYCMLPYAPEEIVEKLCRPPPLIRPSVSMGAAPPDAVSVMRQCWSEAPDLRPDFDRLHDIFRHLHRGRKINIIDSMFEMLEKYSNNLEELIKERTEQLDMEKKKTEQLLNRMLPRSVAERLMLGMRVEPEEFEEVSIYFSDIVGFTAIAARSTPVQVVDLLNDLYTTFDAAIEQYRVYKVETIGDAYMVVGGLPLRARDHAESVATMALHLLHLAGRFRVRHLPAAPLHLRIGLHTGPCCAAVVGLTMPRYCLFGDTVNTASRMESTGAAWRIQVSAATAERLTAAGGYRLRSRGLTQVKGKGAMHTYWLLGKDGFDKPLPTPPPLQSEEVLFETDGENEVDSEACSSPAYAPASATAPVPAPPVERQRSDPSPTSDKFAWQRSGAASADNSPPPRAPPPARYRYLRPSVSTLGGFGDVPAAPESWTSGGSRSLRRQWSLEHGDALAAAAAAGTETPRDPPEPLEPLALRVPSARAPPPRYRTRSDVPDHARPP